MLVKASSRPRIEVPLYDGSPNLEALTDWVSSLDKYFDYEEVDDKKKVKFAATRLKGHAALWWDKLQLSRERKGKPKIKKWEKMVSKMKGKFLLKDYQLNLFIQLQNLKQKGMTDRKSVV